MANPILCQLTVFEQQSFEVCIMKISLKTVWSQNHAYQISASGDILFTIHRCTAFRNKIHSMIKRDYQYDK